MFYVKQYFWIFKKEGRAFRNISDRKYIFPTVKSALLLSSIFIFFRLKAIKGKDFTIGEVYERAGKTVISAMSKEKTAAYLDCSQSPIFFFARSFRYTASYRHGYLDFQMYRDKEAGPPGGASPSKLCWVWANALPPPSEDKTVGSCEEQIKARPS